MESSKDLHHSLLESPPATKIARLAGMIVGTVLVLGIVMGESNAQESSKPKPDTPYKIVAKQSCRCLEVAGAGKQDGANVQQWWCHDGDHQKWIFKPAGAHGGSPTYQIIAVHSGKCLDVAGASMNDGANVIQYTWHGSDNQRWKVIPAGGDYYQIQSVQSNKSLDVAGASVQDGANVIQFSWHNGDNQMWRLEEVSQPPAVASGPTLGLKNDFLIHGAPNYENTEKVIPPSSGCQDGKIALLTGGPSKILSRPLYDNLGNIDTKSKTASLDFPISATQLVATDNQLLRLKDGSLLAVRDGTCWDAMSPPPAWSNERITVFNVNHNGMRGCELIFRSTDCGSSWKLYSVIDFGTFLNGKYGVPRPAALDDNGNLVADVPVEKQGKHPDGSLMWWVGGGDRTEVYACPFTGYIYLTTRVISGPYKNIAPGKPNQTLLLYSKDTGKTWEAIKEDFPQWAPLVMTSTPDRRLFLFQVIGAEPTIYFSKTPVTPNVKPEISPAHPVYYVENGVNLPNTANKNPLCVDMELKLNFPSISRISTDAFSSKIRVAYMSENSSGQLEARIIRIEVQNPNQKPVVTPVKTIRAENPKDYSVMYFTFIDPDYIDMPAGVKSNASLFYWIEAPKTGLSNRKYAVRGAVFEGEFNTTCPAYLSVKNGAPRTWSTRKDPGDYMTGGFFWRNNSLNYVAQWADPEGIKANVVTLPYEPPSGSPKMTVTAVWQPGNEEEVQVYDGKYEDYRKKYDALWTQGWRLHILKNRVVNEQVLYTAVWRKGTSGEKQVYGWRYEDFRKKYDDLWKQGWRLHILSNYVVNNQVLYTAVWRPSTSGEIQAYGWPYHDFRKKYDELWNQDWRLHILSNYVVSGQVFYTAVWRPSTSGEIQVYGWPYEDFRKKYDELWCEGLRLKILNAY